VIVFVPELLVRVIVGVASGSPRYPENVIVLNPPKVIVAGRVIVSL